MKAAQHYLPSHVSGWVRGGFNSALQGLSWVETMKGIQPGEIWADTNEGWTIADRMIKAGEIFSQRNCEVGPIWFRCFADGDEFCCVGDSFTNLQDSNDYEFGYTFEAAINNYINMVEQGKGEE